MSSLTKPLVIFGASELAEVACFYFKYDSPYEVVALAVDSEYLKEDSVFGLPTIAFDTIERAFPPSHYDMFIAVGYTDINRFRQRKCHEARHKGYKLASYISSLATIWPQDFSAGDNCFILEQNNIQPFVRIGNNVMLWSGNHIGHHSIIEDNCFITSHVVVSGGVTIGQGSFIGVNATLRDHIRIGEYCVIGAGATVLKGTVDYAVISGKAGRMLPMRSDQLKHV